MTTESSIGGAFIATLPAEMRAHFDASEVEVFLHAASRIARTKYIVSLEINADFAVFVAERLSRQAAGSQSLEALCTEDLYLSWSCAKGQTDAISALQSEFFSSLDRMRMNSGLAIEKAEFWQRLSERLFVGSSPTIASYEGRSSLYSWLRVVVSRTIIDLHRSESSRKTVQEQDLVDNFGLFSKSAEQALLRFNFEGDMRQAFAQAMTGLTARQRNLLRMHYLRGIPINDIAKVYGLHRVSISRALASARKDLSRLLQKTITQDGQGDLEEILNLVDSQLDLSLERLLASSKDY